MRIVNQILGMQKIHGFQILFCRFIALSSTNSEQSPFLFTPMTFILRVMDNVDKYSKRGQNIS